MMDPDQQDQVVTAFCQRIIGATGNDFNVSLAEYPDSYTDDAIHNCGASRLGGSCGGEFRCARCRKRVGWCFGCADEITNGLCDTCTVDIWKYLGVSS